MVLHASSNDNRDKNSKTQDKQYNEAGHFDESIDSTKHELSRRGNNFRPICNYIQGTRKKVIFTRIVLINSLTLESKFMICLSIPWYNT